MNEIRPITADMRGLFDAQRAAFLQREAPSLQERRADLKKLADAIGRIGDRLEAAISADFGNRSRHETKLGEVFPAQSASGTRCAILRAGCGPSASRSASS